MRPQSSIVIRRPLYRTAARSGGWAALAVAVGMATPVPAVGPGRVAEGGPPLGQAHRASSEPASAAQVYQAICIKCHDRDGRGKTIRQIMPELPDFTDPQWQGSRSDEELGRSILEGKGKLMKPMGSKLGSVGVKQMVAFIRSFRDGRQDVPDTDDPAPRPAASARPDPDHSPHPNGSAVAPGPAAVPPPRARVPVPPPAARPDPPSRPSGAAPATAGGARLFQSLCLRCHGADGRGEAEMRAGLPALPDFTVPGWQARRSDHQLEASILGGKGTQMPSFREHVGAAGARALVAQVRAFGPGGAPPVDPAATEFQSRFRQLQQEWEELARQARALGPP